jgi:DNA-directed RNA polymerase specialized sigma24 family protein
MMGRLALIILMLTLPLSALALHAATGPGPEDEAVSNAAARAVRAALVRLPRLDREALLLVTAGDLRAADAARLLGISESGVRMRTLRARRRLAALLEDQHGPKR